MRLVTVKKCFVKGTEDDFKGKTQNTSYIERFNLTLRQRVSYLVSERKCWRSYKSGLTGKIMNREFTKNQKKW